MKKALITGVTGQDGSFLAELLLEKGYEVHGTIRRSSSFNTGRIQHLYQDALQENTKLLLHYGDLMDGLALQQLVDDIQPDEVYHLGAQSHVGLSFEQPVFTADVVALGTVRLLEAIRRHQDRTGRTVRFYQASSSEMFGSTPPPQSETTPFHPRSPYACGKVYGFWQSVNYRESYGMFVSNGILFNHESERRGETFVSRKITRAATRIKLGLQKKLYLGNLEARRDWGYAPEYVEGMWRMLQADVPEDFVLATGTSCSVKDFVEKTFGLLALDYRDFVETHPKYVRPAEVDALQGDASKAKAKLGWEAQTNLDGLVQIMVAADLELAKQEKLLLDNHHKIVVPLG